VVAGAFLAGGGGRETGGETGLGPGRRRRKMKRVSGSAGEGEPLSVPAGD